MKVCLHIFRNLKMGGCQTLALSIIQSNNRLKHVIVYLNDDVELLDAFNDSADTVHFIDQKKGKAVVSEQLNEIMKRYSVNCVISWFYPYTLRLEINSKKVINHIGMAALPLRNLQFYKNIANYLFYRRKIKSQTSVFASEHIKNTFSKYFYPSSSSHVIHNGIPTLKYKNNIRKKENIVTMVGRLDGSKDFDSFIKLANESCFDNLKFFIAGCGDDSSRLKELNKKCGGNAVFLGLVEDVPELLSRTKVSIFLNKPIEGFGNVIIESMASGCIVISNNIGASKEIIIDNISGFLVEDYSELKAVLYRTVASEFDANELTIEAKNKVDSAFDIKITANKYLELM